MVAPGMNSFYTGARHISKRLLASYVIDWILILGIAALGGGLNRVEGARHAFSLSDPNISFPYKADTVTVGVLLIVSVIVPGIVTAVVSLLFVPGPTAVKSTPKALIWRRKIWEWNTAWMGLGIALAGAFMITEGLKDIAGRPRPHLLALCDPDLSPESIARWQVGGLGRSIESAVPIIVDWHICRRANDDAMHNAFASWPSGHSSFSWAGMFYLTLYLSAKFAIQVPFLPASSYNSRKFISTFTEEDDDYVRPSANSPSSSDTHQESSIPIPPRNEAAAPPVYLLIIAFVPIGVALFISISRWFDYRHNTFDIISGSLIGLFTAWFGFRWYHLPIRQGSGWSWGARSRERAFWLGVGVPTYVGDEGWESKNYTGAKQIVNRRRRDLEAGNHRGVDDVIMGGGVRDNPAKTTANAGKLQKSRSTNGGSSSMSRGKDSSSRVDSDETQRND